MDEKVKDICDIKTDSDVYSFGKGYKDKTVHQSEEYYKSIKKIATPLKMPSGPKHGHVTLRNVSISW